MQHTHAQSPQQVIAGLDWGDGISAVEGMAVTWALPQPMIATPTPSPDLPPGSDVLDEVTERRLLTRNLRTANALTDPTVLEPVIAGVTAGSKGRAQCRGSGAVHG
ncbi:hypothetical protein [Streptomyces sp. NPDC058335]|uniref:hypothetical protein n=1 Tax=Streptomyces sp. NPDC058335 TaxID=3346451 RepID=UPI00364D7127